MNRPRPAGRSITLALVACLGATACADLSPTSPASEEPVHPLRPRLALQCVASRAEGTVDCDGPTAGGIRATPFGGQNVRVKLTSSNVSYDSGTEIFQFDVTVQNLMPEAIGTPAPPLADPDGIQVFFQDDPVATAGTGVISVANADGVGTFTNTNQSFFAYHEILARNQVSAPKTWQLSIPPSVSTFSFVLYVEADVEYRLVINEVMTNPGGSILDANGEWFELYNAGSLPVPLQGLVIADSSGSGRRPYHTINAAITIPAGGYAVLGNTSNTTDNGGVPVDYAYGAALQLANSSDALKVSRVVGTDTVTIDRTQYSAAASVQNGISRELSDPTLDNSNMDGSSWVDADMADVFGPGGRGTPRAANDGSIASAGPAVTVSVSPSSVAVDPGETTQLSATPRDSAGATTTSSITWLAADTTIATVTGSGLVTGRAAGSTLVVVSIPSGAADTAYVTVTASGTATYLDHLAFGTPTFTAGDPGVILLNKVQYVVGYLESRGGPAWVSWDLNATHFGDADRCDCFSPDAQLPGGVNRITTSDYTGSGYSRGHMVMSEQRTATDEDNRATFLMTNVLPQLQTMNGGPWLQFETLANDSAQAGREVYNVAGGAYSGSPATLNGAGEVQIPDGTWKVIVIMDGGEGLADVSSASDIRVLAVYMAQSATGSWQSYLTTVDAIEALTGLDLLSSLPDGIEASVEAGGGT